MHTINPSSLTDRELAEFAERMLYSEGGGSVPREWQRELVKRLIQKL